MQFQVPQFIDTEDKIVGSLSLRQFAFVAAGALVSALFYFFAQFWLWIIVSMIVFSITVSLAFVKIQGRPFATVALAALRFYWQPQTYVWKPEQKIAPTPLPVKNEAESSGLAEILAKAVPAKPITRESVSSGVALHKSWENVQTGMKKRSDKQFFDQKMAERYEILQKTSGERKAAHRIDYR